MTTESNHDELEPVVLTPTLDDIVDAETAPVRRTPVVARNAVITVTTLAKSTPARWTARTVARQAYLFGKGAESWWAKARDSATMGAYQRQILLHEKSGDSDRMGDWSDRYERAKNDRHKRLMDAPKTLLSVATLASWSLVGLLVLLLVVSVVAQFAGGSFAAVWLGVWAVVTGAYAVGAFLASIWWVLLTVALTAAAVREGKRATTYVPTWLQSAAERSMELDVRDSSVIGAALGALGLSALNNHLKQGLPLTFLDSPHKDGRGVGMSIMLPSGVTGAAVADKREILAGNLHRATVEVWPTVGDTANTLDLWVADKGALAAGAGDYPLLTAGFTDVFKGVPAGKTLRGEELLAPIMEYNTIVGGMSGQGKSNAARIIVAGCALDPTVELRLWIPDENMDFERFRPRASSYIMGRDQGSLSAIMDGVRGLLPEMERRSALLSKHEAEKVTRELALKVKGLHPLVVLLEEAQVLFTHAEYGAEAKELLVEQSLLARKRGIHIIISTQAPSSKTIPIQLTENCASGISFAVTRWQTNDALLGQGAYESGIRATELRPGVDRGTAVVRGWTDNRSEVVQWYRLSGSKEHDQVSPMVDRVLAKIGGSVEQVTYDAPESRDLLADLGEILRDGEKVKVAELPPRLRQLAPNWPQYKALSGVDLEALVAAAGVRVTRSSRQAWLDSADLRIAVLERGE